MKYVRVAQRLLTSDDESHEAIIALNDLGSTVATLRRTNPSELDAGFIKDGEFISRSADARLPVAGHEHAARKRTEELFKKS